MNEIDELVESTGLLIATFEIDGHFFGIASTNILEIVRLGEFTPVHNSPDFILGIVNLRGRIVTVVDLGQKLGLESLPPRNDSQIFVVNWRQEAIGLLVDCMGNMIQIEGESIHPVPPNVQPLQAAVLDGFVHVEDSLIGLLRVNSLLD